MKRIERTTSAVLLLCLAGACAVLQACSQSGMTPIKRTSINSQNSDDAAQEANRILTQPDFKKILLQELMRYHASAKYLVHQPTTQSQAPSGGCVDYEVTDNNPDAFMVATYNCAWGRKLQTNTLKSALTDTENFVKATDPTKPATATADLTLTLSSSKPSSKAIRTEAYKRSVAVITPASMTTPAGTPDNTVAQVTASSSLNAAASTASTSTAPFSMVSGFPFRRPTPTPSPGTSTKARDSWAAKLVGYWKIINNGLDLADTAFLSITYTNSGSNPITLQLNADGVVTFDESAGGCPRPSGKFKWRRSGGGIGTQTGELSVDAVGFRDLGTGTDKMDWPEGSCMEFLAKPAQ